MPIEREQIGETQNYRGHKITVHEMAIDVICRVDGADLPNFYVDAEAARKGGMRYIDQIEKESKK